MTYWRIDPVLWDDEAFCGLDDLARSVWLVLLTGPQVTALPGLQRGSVATLADTLRRAPEEVAKACRELRRKGMLELDEQRRVIRLPKAPRYNPAESPNHIKAWWKRWQEIPDCAAKHAHIESLRIAAGLENKSHAEVWDKTFGDLPKTSPSPSGSPPEGLPQAIPNSASATASASAAATAPAFRAQAREAEGSAPAAQAPPLALVREPEPSPTKPDPIAEVFDHWRRVMKHPRAVLDDKRRKLIREAVRRHGPDDCRRAIDGNRADPWHQGQNDRGQVYDDIELILRDSRHVEKFLRIADGTAGARRPAGARVVPAPVADRFEMPDVDPAEQVLLDAAARRAAGGG